MKNKFKHQSPWGTSLRVLIWDKLDVEPTLTEKLISSTVKEWYKAKHRDPSKEEIKLINNIDIIACPVCGSASLKKAGFNNEGIQQYKCKDCNVKFTALTNTIFQDRKIPISEWIEYLMHLFEFHSVVTSARDNRNASTTGTYWLHKVFAVLEDIQKNVVLEGNTRFVDRHGDEHVIHTYNNYAYKNGDSYVTIDSKLFDAGSDWEELEKKKY